MKKIIFDLDNTLLFLSNEWKRYLQSFLDTQGINIDAFTLFNTVLKYEDTVSDVIVTKNDLKEYLNETLFLNIDNDTFNKLLNCYNNIPIQNPEIIQELLLKLSKKYELIAYTNWFTNDQIERLSRYNLDIYFSRIYGWDIITAKPSLNGLLTIIGNDDPKNYIFVGDNIRTDLQMPSNIGMDTIFLNLKNIEQTQYKEIKKIEELTRRLDK